MLFVVEDKEFCPHIFSKKVVDEFNALGYKSQSVYLGSLLASMICKSLPERHLHSIPNVLKMAQLIFYGIFKFKARDFVLIYESNGLQSFVCLRKILFYILKLKDIKIFSIVQDGWMFTKNKLQNRNCNFFIHNSNVVLGVTPYLVESLLNMSGKNNVELFEEPIDISAFKPNFVKKSSVKTIVWSGPPTRVVKEFEKLKPILEKVFAIEKFKLKIITGRVRPKLDINIPYDWMPFIGTSYEEQFKDTDIAFAYYEDSNYGKCKGNYKVKTYMSAGCAVVTSPVGYNKVLIKEGKTGFFALTDDEWFQKLVFLLQNDCVCLKIRKNARKFVVNNYSYGVLLKKYLDILRKYNYL